MNTVEKEIEDLSDKGFYVISDTHFYHSNIIKYCERPFRQSNGEPDVEKMNMTLFENWNNTVKDKDVIFHLGDLTMGFQKKQVAIILDQNLKGDKRYLIGNHDFPKMIPGKMIKSNVHYVMYKGLKIGMSHYPHRDLNEKLECDIFLYGHIHQNSKDTYNSYNCCVEVNDYRPKHISEIISILIERNKT